MQWLITLETEQDLIVTCRLMNVFRRKGMKINTLAMATRPHCFSMMAVLDSPESDIDHLLAAGGIKTEAFRPSSFPRRRLCGELDYDADPGDVATKVQLVIDALRQPPNAPA